MSLFSRPFSLSNKPLFQLKARITDQLLPIIEVLQSNPDKEINIRPISAQVNRIMAGYVVSGEVIWYTYSINEDGIHVAFETTDITGSPQNGTYVYAMATRQIKFTEDSKAYQMVNAYPNQIGNAKWALTKPKAPWYNKWYSALTSYIKG